jgi:hypothetical protein
MEYTTLAIVAAEATVGPSPLQMPINEAFAAASLDEKVQHRIVRATSLESAAQALRQLLSGGFAVWTDGSLLETRARVDTVRGLRIEIRTREHGPPHFHVMASDTNASFAIKDCRLLTGQVSGRNQQLIEYWYASARPLLVEKWNETRPSDCPVGPISE